MDQLPTKISPLDQTIHLHSLHIILNRLFIKLNEINNIA